MPDPGRRAYQVAGLVLVTCGAAGQVHDRADAPGHRGHARARGQVADDVRDTVGGLAGLSAQHPDVGSGGPQQGHDEAPEGSGAAGHEDGSGQDGLQRRGFTGMTRREGRM